MTEVCRSELKHTKNDFDLRFESLSIELKAQNEAIHEVSAKTWKVSFKF